MAYVRTLKLALIASTITTGIFIIHINAVASERGFRTVAGTKMSKQKRSIRKKVRVVKKRKRGNRRGKRYDSNLERLIAYGLVTELDERNDRRENERYDLKRGELRNKVSYSPLRTMSKIIHVSDEMLELGEERAARREERMIDQIDEIDIRFYRDNEAYDVRYPSIVYLKMPDK